MSEQTTKHMPGRWSVGVDYTEQGILTHVEDANGNTVVMLTQGEHRANATRIVADHNALAGYNPEAVREVVEALRESRQWVDHSVAYVRDVSKAAAQPGIEMLEKIDAALAKLTSQP